MTEKSQGVLLNGDIAANILHDRIDGNEVTGFRKNLGLAPNGLPANGSKVKVVGHSTCITIKEKKPDPTRINKTIWVPKTVYVWKFISFGHSCPVEISNPEYMEDNVVYEAIVTSVCRLTDRRPTLTLSVLY